MLSSDDVMMQHMRTTLTLDDDVARLVEDAMHRDRRTMKAVVNEALRRGLGAPAPAEPFQVRVHHTRLRPGIDPARMNQLADEFEDEALLARMKINQ